jgi:hypothetical protein
MAMERWPDRSIGFCPSLFVGALLAPRSLVPRASRAHVQAAAHCPRFSTAPDPAIMDIISGIC